MNEHHRFVSGGVFEFCSLCSIGRVVVVDAIMICGDRLIIAS